MNIVTGFYCVFGMFAIYSYIDRHYIQPRFGGDTAATLQALVIIGLIALGYFASYLPELSSSSGYYEGEDRGPWWQY